MRLCTSLLALAGLVPAPSLAADPPQTLPVGALSSAPALDGDLRDWGRESWTKVKIKPAVDKGERQKLGLDGEDRNHVGAVTVEVKAGTHKGKFYLAARWPDDAADVEYKGWEWNGAKYSEGRKRDDMFAVRFHLDGEFDRSMLSSKTYRVDAWVWSAARSNPAGLAEDALHHFTTKVQESAAEYEVPGIGTVYIKRQRDAGNPMYKVVRPPKAREADRVPSFEISGNASGSAADVAAKGQWKDGHWSLELARAMETGNADDLAFKPGQKLLGQIAVWNRSSDEHKSVSEPLIFELK